MSTKDICYTLVYTNDKNDPVSEEYRDLEELQDRLSTIDPPDPRFLLVAGPVVPFERETTIRIGAKPAAKTRKPRRSKAQIEADEKAKAAASKAKANGAGAVTS